MALLKDKFNEIPVGAVVLTEQEALEYQTKIMKKWKKTSDVLAFNYGSYVLGAASFFTGFYINSYYRNKFKLFHYGRASSYLPICVIPATLSTILHAEFVLKEVLLLKRKDCPICLEMRASALQAFSGCVLPAVLGPVSSMAIAHKYATYNIPFITSEPKKVFQLVKNISRPISNILLSAFIAQSILATVVTYFEGESVFKVNLKLAQLENQLVKDANLN